MSQNREPEIRQPVDRKTRKARLKLIGQLTYIFGTLIFILILGGTDPQLNTLFTGKLPLDARWLTACALAMILFWTVQACGYAYIGRIVGVKLSYWANLRLTLFGEYYSAITPFSSGGQPIQLGYYRRYGVNAAKGSSILAVRYIGYVSSVCVLYLCAMFVNGSRILASFPLVFWLTAFGFAINFLSIVTVVLLLFRESLVRSTGVKIVRGLTRLPWFKTKREKWLAAFHRGMEEFSAAAECIRSHPLKCFIAFLILLISVLSEFSVAYLVYRALGLREASYFELLAMQVFLYLAVSFAPTSGATGATEGGFYLFFTMMFPKALLYGAMLLWRLFTYYSHLLVGGGLVVLDELGAIRRQRAARRDKEASDESPASETPEGPMDCDGASGAAPNPKPTENAGNAFQGVPSGPPDAGDGRLG